jgi:hypothetical protein
MSTLFTTEYPQLGRMSDRELCHLGIEGPSVTGTMEQVFHERSARLQRFTRLQQDEEQEKNRGRTREQRLIEHCCLRVDNLHSTQLFRLAKLVEPSNTPPLLLTDGLL